MIHLKVCPVLQVKMQMFLQKKITISIQKNAKNNEVDNYHKYEKIENVENY